LARARPSHRPSTRRGRSPPLAATAGGRAASPRPRAPPHAMGNTWGRKVPLKEVLRKNKREINKAMRELDRERANLEKQEQKLIADIKKYAGQGQMGSVKIMAKDLVRTRTYITKFIELRSHLGAVSLKLQTVKSQEAMASAMKSVTQAMIKMNKTVNVPAVQKIMMNFQLENERAEMTQEMMGDMLDDAMEQDGDEEEEEKIVGAVLDEIGISFGDTVPAAPTLAPNQPQAADVPAAPVAVADAGGGGGGGADASTVSDLEARLNNLRK
jgi:charged multivesicular body protein 2A